MRCLIASLLCVAVSLSAFASDGGYKLNYDGGSVTSVKTGEHMRLYLDQDHIRIMHDDTEILNLPASAVTEIS